MKPVGLPFVPKNLAKNIYISALKVLRWLLNLDYNKEVSIHKDFDLLVGRSISMIQINSQKDFNSFRKNFKRFQSDQQSNFPKQIS